MAKVLLLNGSPHEHGCTDAALREVARTLEENGVQTMFRWIGVKPVAGCIACGKCKESGVCIFDDLVNELIGELDGVDALVVGSPVYYAGPSGQICALLDRLFYAASGRLAGKPAAAVVSCRRGGASAAFDRLNKYFTINRMPVVSSQYWNQVHGRAAEDVALDEEGLQTMRTLGRNMAWLLRCVERGAEAGDALPPRETPIQTNFIR